jgi:hypothetical protein
MSSEIATLHRAGPLALTVEYGACTQAFAVFLQSGTGHNALLTEPMLVFGAGQYRNNLAAGSCLRRRRLV